jgi:hypothetical protein
VARTIPVAVKELCLAFPGAEETISHGSPGYAVRGRFFAYYTVNHHGDGRVALLVNAPPGAQAACVYAEPKHYFVPPYVGPRGWLGINLDRGIAWPRVVAHTRDAWLKVVPSKLASQLGAIDVKPPTARKLKPEELDPLRSARGKRLLSAMRRACGDLPDVTEDAQHGHPVWRAGGKVFARAWHHDGRFNALFWVGVAAQALMTRDARYSLPPYFGPSGWIALDAGARVGAAELRNLALESYRHFASKRMVARLGG